MFEKATEIEKEKFQKFFSQLPVELKEKEDRYKAYIDAKRLSKKARIFPIFQMTDALMAPAADLVVCKKGCSNCCKKPVSITKQEAEYIAFKEGLVVQVDNFSFFPSQAVSGDCPFLKDEVCSIYANRPYNCRREIEFDNASKCSSDETKTMSIHWTGVELVLMETSEYQVSDIRFAFKPK